MKFDGIKCDECGRIKGEVNHWVELHAAVRPNGDVVGLIAGPLGDNVITAGEFTNCKLTPLDLCGYDCSTKYICKFVGLLPPTEKAPASEN